MGDIQQNNNQVSFSENSDEQYSNLMGNQEFIAEYPVAPGIVELSIPVKPVHHTKEKKCLMTCKLAGAALEKTMKELELDH